VTARRPAAALALVAAVCAVSAAAAELPDESDRALPCRPTLACTADFVPPGTFEIEAGALHRRLSADTPQWTFPLLFKLTLIDDLQWQVGTNGYTLLRGKTPADYLDDVVVGPKLRLHQQGEIWPSLAISAQASIPTFRRAGYLRTYDALLTLYVTKDLGPVHVDSNFGLNLWRIEDPLPQVFTATAISMNLLPTFQVMAEGYVFSDASPVAARDAGTLFAVSETVLPWLVLDEGADLALFRDTRSFSLFVGLTIVPAVFWRPPARSR
jgi:hypothetical protein